MEANTNIPGNQKRLTRRLVTFCRDHDTHSV
jgi:hypothetical protein